MQLALDIQDQDIVRFIQNKNLDEIKQMVTDFLGSQIKKPPLEKKGKWAKVADEMKGTMSTETRAYLEQCSQEVRSGFALRDL
jgi:hypothetical protein